MIKQIKYKTKLCFVRPWSHREQRNCSRNINKNVLPLNIAFLCLLALLKPHLQTKYKHSFAIDRTEPPLLE